MSAKVNGAKRNGRAASVREWLRKQRTWKSAREVLDAVEPEGDINLMCATLGTLHRYNAVLKDGVGQGNVRWKIAPPRHAVRSIAADRPKAAPKPARKATARPTNSATPAPKPARMSILPAASPTPAKKPAAAFAEREQRTNFSAPLATVDRLRPRANSRESVDQFLRRGGVIQQLASHECSQPLKLTIAATHADMRPARKRKPSNAAIGA